MIGKLARGAKGDEGLGLVLVMALITIITALMALAVTIGINSLSGSRRHVTFEQALGAAENGVDFGLARLQTAFTAYGTDYPIPSPPTTVQTTPACNAASISTGVSSFTSNAAEQAWARSTLLALAVSNPECIRDGTVGQYILVKPTDKQAVYAMGFAPSYAAWKAGQSGSIERLLKAEYIFAPYRPTNAVLTGSNLTIGSSTTVTSAGADPSLASVHANGSVFVTNGNPTVYGPVSSTGSSTASSNNFYSNPGGAVKPAPLVSVPQVSARTLYFQNVANYSSSQWYDLCPDGTVRRGSTSGPCASSTIWATLPADGSTSFRGWTYTKVGSVVTWTASSSTLDGVYYAQYANIDVINGNGTINNISIIAESLNNSDCATKSLGNIYWDHYDMSRPMIPNLFMLAGQDLVTDSNYSAGSGGPPVVAGLFVAGDQISMQTSSNGAYGAVIAADRCSISGSPVSDNEVKNPSIYYDPTADAPFTSIISTTLWLEYVG